MNNRLFHIIENKQTSFVIRSSGTVCSIDTVVAALIIDGDDDKDVSTSDSVRDAIISNLSFSL